MGQQQLLLVILVTIIVGVATVVAINTFSSAADNANLDAVRNDMATIASSAQGYYMKPDMMGGGGNSFTGMTFDDLAFATDGSESSGATEVTNGNGTYTLSINADNFTITAVPAQADGNIVAYVEKDCMDMSDYDPNGSASSPGSCSSSS
ncbi:hypothetical protein LQ318_02500 [Aliifodinibius salicampi]|uniref:Type II secretory pathway, pseudopilin PulG n=1 Tax=Fodinibius salicampi TaxID=1920655 RepID=A0ABT3PVA7_9BACT|nr:hypothetical protein [Fodinibius salicampi]MCW9711763.1 hypothetical protein [Fodinibius salicampi]